MIWMFIIYLLFQVIYDHWATDTTAWKVTYFAFQYGWIAALALYQVIDKPRYKGLYALIALIFSILSLNELTWLSMNNADYVAMTTGSPPAYGLSILALALFFWLILQKNIQWER